MNIEKIIEKYEHLYGHHVIICDYLIITPNHYKVKLREQYLQYIVDVIYENDRLNIINGIGENLLRDYPEKQLEKFQKGVKKYVKGIYSIH